MYDGCPVFAAGDPYNADISSAPVNPYSSTIIAGLPNIAPNNGGPGYEQVNLANNSTPEYTIQPNASHNPPFFNETVAPWESSYFIEPLVDGHAMVLNTDTCKMYEFYQVTFSSGRLGSYGGRSWNLASPFQQGPASLTYASMASDLSIFAGAIKWNGEMAVGKINHALNFGFPTGQGVSQWGYVYPASSATGISCSGNCSHPLHYGDHLRLHSSVVCPTETQAAAICNAMKHFGIFYADQGGGFELYFVDADGGGRTNPGYNMTSINGFLGSIHTSDFDVITDPTHAVTCQSGHTCT